MASMFQKATQAFRGQQDAGGAHGQDGDDGESLTSILQTAEDRSALTLLICDITEVMRKQILDAFDPKETGGAGGEEEQFEVEKGEGGAGGPDEVGDTAAGVVNDDDEKARKQQAQKKVAEKQKAALAKREKEVGDEKMTALKSAALDFFDDWRDGVILRVGEVVNSASTPPKEESRQEAKPRTSSGGTRGEAGLEGTELRKDEHDAKIDETLLRLYPPVKTPLCTMDKAKKVLVLHSVLLLMLSLEHYRAHSRTLLLHLTTSLGLSFTVLTEDETKVAQGLLAAAEKMSAQEETKKRADENRTARRLKMGAAGVAGAALIGITGGLAAPFLAAGIGTVLGGIGLGATATAGLLGSLAGSGVLVGGLFGAYGARMTSRAMERYTRDVEDFAFIPVRKPGVSESDSHRLRVAIGVTGWLRDADEAVTPWTVIGSGQEGFALRYEVEALIRLGDSLRALITSAAWKFARSEIIKRTVFSALMAGLWPIGLANVGKIIDNPWMIANQRAQKAGEVLADALINKAQGERPVTLIGYSLGAKVVYNCLQELARRRAFGLVENAVLLGAPTPSDSAEWRRVRAVVTGRVVNAYSTQDYILAFLYRSSSVQFGVAGLHPVRDVAGVENVDASDLVEGHTLYRHAAGPILRRAGFEDVDARQAAREDRRLREQEREEREQREAAGKDKEEEEEAGEKDTREDKVRETEQDREQDHLNRKMEKMNVSG
ncbi:DUF726-domain-containing protein [Xylariaceae sp. FL0804]|nr:DUF726-domain-containing protein [Xylariaceae sp. FL0804]